MAKAKIGNFNMDDVAEVTPMPEVTPAGNERPILNGEDMRELAMEIAKATEDRDGLPASTLAEQAAGREALARVATNQALVDKQNGSD